MVEKKSLFGTSGIRGDAEKLFTEQFCFDMGRTYVEFLRKISLLGPIAVGMDPRASSPRIKEAIFKGLATGGTQLFDEGVTPIASVNWIVKNTEATGGIMITGSHISPELNGVKFYARDQEVTPEDESQIEEIYWDLKDKMKPSDENPKVVVETRAKDLYIELLISLAKNPYPRWKVAVDCANGAQSVVMPHLLRQLGLNVIEVNCDPQDEFIARDTDAEDKARLEDIKKKVVEEKCDFGIAYDGDGDRVVFIDEKGNFVQGEYSCGLVAKESEGKKVVTTIAASQVVDYIGKDIVRVRVGSPYVTAKMREVGASFGFEQNGGAVSAEIMYTRDGGGMTMKLLNIFSGFKGTFSEFIGQLPRFYMSRTKVDYRWELKEKILKDAKEHFKGVKVDETDGLKIWIDETTWMLFRSSMNAPEFRVFAESKDKKTSERLLQEGIDFVNNIIKE